MDLTTLLQRSCTTTERIVQGIAVGQLDQPTPCAGWTARDVLNHLVGTLHFHAACLADATPAIAIAADSLPDRDLVQDDPLKAYRLGAEAILTAATADALAGVHQTPLGDMPGAVEVALVSMDIVVHGWDLARATGQDAVIEPDLAGEILERVRPLITEQNRAPHIGPEVTLDADASSTDRLVAYLGRTP